jgi:AcrR family transcriptional regulator
LSENSHAALGQDRRVRKSVKAIHDAFAKLFFEKGFNGFSVSELIAAADIARSTFYQHYSSKEDVLCALMTPMLRPVAACAWHDQPPKALAPVAEHWWSNRRRANAIFEEPTKTALTRLLADLIEVSRPPSAGGAPPPRLISMSLARWALGMLEEWQSGKHKCPPDIFAATIHKALFGASRALNA